MGEIHKIFDAAELGDGDADPDENVVGQRLNDIVHVAAAAQWFLLCRGTKTRTLVHGQSINQSFPVWILLVMPIDGSIDSAFSFLSFRCLILLLLLLVLAFSCTNVFRLGRRTILVHYQNAFQCHIVLLELSNDSS